jgi:hypothetical protein
MATTTFHLRVSTRFFEPPGRVWASRTDPAALAREFPFWARFSLADPAALASAIGEGRPVEAAGRLGLVSWPLSLVAVEPGVSLADRSENALFSRFEHTLMVEAVRDGTRCIETVTFTPRMPAKLSAILTQRLFVQRHVRAAVGLSADARTVGVSVLRVWDPEEDEPAGA